jgi:hypothetical protein
MDSDWNPWNVKDIKPSLLILDEFESWDKFTANPRQKAWNRAIKWLSDIIQLPCEETAGNHLRVIDKDQAFKFLTRSIFVDKSFDNFLRSCMIPPQKSSTDDSTSSTSESGGSASANLDSLHSAAHSGHLEKKGKICKNTWKGIECNLTDCKYVHKDPCKDRECLALMGGLPVWRSRNCQKWHIRPKKQKKSRSNGLTVKSAVKSTRNGQDSKNPRNSNGKTSFRGSNHLSTAPLHHPAIAGHPKKRSYSAVAKGSLGKEKAAFANKPLNRGGKQNQNQHQRWGQQENQHLNQHLSQKLVQQLMKKSSEAVIQELKRKRLI